MKGLHDMDMQSFEDRCLSSSHKSFHFLCTFYSTASIPLDGSLTKSCINEKPFILLRDSGKEKQPKWILQMTLKPSPRLSQVCPLYFSYHFFSFNFVYFSLIIRVCLIMILGNAFRCFSIWTLRMLLIVIW